MIFYAECFYCFVKIVTDDVPESTFYKEMKT